METNNPKTEPVHNAETSGDKTIAIIAYLTFIGLIIAFVMNQEKKDDFGAYHIRQSLGLCLSGLALSIINVLPILGWIISLLGGLLLLVLWVMGLINAINHKKEPVPVLGKYFEEWFKNV
jgi:uncharacterized membrane protein